MSTFLDTDVVVYAFDTADPDKQARALAILDRRDRLVVSTQVLLEVWWVLTRRVAEPLDEDRASEVVDTLAQLPVVHTDPELVLRAIATSRRHRLAVWDALILEAARTGGCRRVLSEDLQDGFTLDNVTVSDPFR